MALLKISGLGGAGYEYGYGNKDENHGTRPEDLKVQGNLQAPQMQDRVGINNIHSRISGRRVEAHVEFATSGAERVRGLGNGLLSGWFGRNGVVCVGSRG